MSRKPVAPPPSLLQMMRDKISPLIPVSLKQRYYKLTAQQQQMVTIGSIGLVVFLVVWCIFSALFQPSPTLMRQAAKSDDTGTATAIVQPAPNFPDSTATVVVAKQDPLDALTLTSEQREQLLKLRQNVNNEYRNVLSFALDEAKMINFAQAATKIDLVNSRWDSLIAGAPDERLASEYLTSATMESRQLLAQSVDLTEAEYNEIYSLTTRDKRFNDVANAYKKLVTDGIWGPVTPTVLSTSIIALDPTLRFPVAPVGKANPTAPTAPGTVPKPVGSPTPPYSPPALR